MFANPKIYQLKNGLRVILDPLPGFDTTTIVVGVNVGSRNENGDVPRSEFGISHLIEHMQFKGTARRSYWDINKETAANGGLANAFTSYNMTAYTMTLLGSRLDFALDMMSDQFMNSTFPEEELDKEKRVVVQEILSYMDNPDAMAEDLVSETCLTGGLAHDIAGSVPGVIAMTRDDLIAYKNAHYTAANSVISISGAGIDDAAAVLAKLEHYFGSLPAGQATDYFKTTYHQGAGVKEKSELEHSYLRIAWPAAPSGNRRKVMLGKVLANIVGQGFHSRLFDELREKQHLVYHINMGDTAFEDIGMMQIEAQTMPENAQKVFAATAKVINDLKTNLPIGEEELGRAKAIIKSARTLKLEYAGGRADYFARMLFMFGEIGSAQDYLAEVDTASVAEIRALADEMFATKPTIVVYGAAVPGLDLEKMAGLF